MHHMEHIWTMVMLKICKHTFYANLSQIWKFTRFIRKAFATKILLSGKFSLFVTLLKRNLCLGHQRWCTKRQDTKMTDNIKMMDSTNVVDDVKLKESWRTALRKQQSKGQDLWLWWAEPGKSLANSNVFEDRTPGGAWLNDVPDSVPVKPDISCSSS